MAEFTDRVVDEGMALVAEVGWSSFSLIGLARRMDTTLAEVQAVLPTADRLLARLAAKLDRAMLDVRPESLDELDPREKIFDLVMRRLDAAKPYRAAIASLEKAAFRDPALQCRTACNLERTATLLLDASGARFTGLRACAARKLVVLLLARVVHGWLRDDSPDLAKTMAELDKRLQQLEQLARWTRPPVRRGRQATSIDPVAAPG